MGRKTSSDAVPDLRWEWVAHRLRLKMQEDLQHALSSGGKPEWTLVPKVGFYFIMVLYRLVLRVNVISVNNPELMGTKKGKGFKAKVAKIQTRGWSHSCTLCEDEEKLCPVCRDHSMFL